LTETLGFFGLGVLPTFLVSEEIVVAEAAVVVEEEEEDPVLMAVVEIFEWKVVGVATECSSTGLRR